MIRKLVALCLLGGLAACDSSGSSQQPAPKLYPDQASAGFKQFSKQCSSCHRPPMPNQHTAQEWAGVLSVMQQHKAQAGMEIMTPSELNEVLQYLQKHSRTPSSQGSAD